MEHGNWEIISNGSQVAAASLVVVFYFSSAEQEVTLEVLWPNFDMANSGEEKVFEQNSPSLLDLVLHLDFFSHLLPETKTLLSRKATLTWHVEITKICYEFSSL